MALQDQQPLDIDVAPVASVAASVRSGRPHPHATRGKRIVIRDGHGSDTLQGFNPDCDLLAFEMAEMRTHADIRKRLSEQGGEATVTFDNGDVLTLQGVAKCRLGPANLTFGAGPVCLAEGTLLYTERGEIPIEDLRPDDILWTKDHGWQAIRLLTLDKMVFRDAEDPAKPVLIPEGALGFARPHSDLIVSPQQRVLQIDEETDDEVLVPAIDLVGRKGIRQMRGKRRIRYLGIVMQRHSVLQAAGCWVESVPVTSHILEHHGKTARHLLEKCKDMKAMRRVERKGIRNRRMKPV